MSEPVEGTRDQTPEDVQRLTPTGITFVEGDTVPGLSSWVLDRRIGGGGFGQVWLVRHAWNAKEKPRAVKFCTDPEARHRLVTHEKNVVLRVMKYAGDHPNVVPLLDCNLDGDFPWLMYEYVEGGTLASLIEQWRELSLPKRLGKAVRTLHGIASALARFHRFDPPLVHRDMKPHNVLMADGRVPRITDFGIGGVAVAQDDNATGSLTAYAARLPSRLHAAGTRLYAPPEQLFGSTPDPRDDVYALGVIAYQIVMADLRAVPGPDATLELRDLKVPVELVSLIVQSVSINAERRPKDATEWEQKLGAVIERKQNQHETSETSLPPAPALLPSPASTQRPPTHTEVVPIPRPAPPPPAEEPLAPPPTRRPPPRAEEPPEPVTRSRDKPKRRKRKQGPSPAVSLALGGVAILVLVVCFVVFVRTGKRPEPTAATRPPDEPKSGTPRPGAGSPAVPPKVNKPEPKVGALAPRPGEACEVEIVDGTTMTFCWIPAGECQLGTPKTERIAIMNVGGLIKEPLGLTDEGEEVRGKYRTSGFWLGKYEVTQAEWAAVMRGTALAAPSFFRIDGPGTLALGGITDTSRFPVESLSYNDCQLFLKRANAHGGVRRAFGRSGAFVLPDENAWEYACRGGLGNQQPYYFGKELNGTQANMNGTRPFGTTVTGPNLGRTTTVGSYEAKFPHPWGLCDVHGNVLEWCDSVYSRTNELILRSGSWRSSGEGGIRASARFVRPPDAREVNFGLRVCIRFD